VFVRGQAQDFDTWAQMGNRGWSYTEVLPFFKRMESYSGAGDEGKHQDSEGRNSSSHGSLRCVFGRSAVAMVVYGTAPVDRSAAPWIRSRRTCRCVEVPWRQADRSAPRGTDTCRLPARIPASNSASAKPSCARSEAPTSIHVSCRGHAFRCAGRQRVPVILCFSSMADCAVDPRLFVANVAERRVSELWLLIPVISIGRADILPLLLLPGLPLVSVESVQ
jgi:choline dehydrogenase-like flavoprotein